MHVIHWNIVNNVEVSQSMENGVPFNTIDCLRFNNTVATYYMYIAYLVTFFSVSALSACSLWSVSFLRVVD